MTGFIDLANGCKTAVLALMLLLNLYQFIYLFMLYRHRKIRLLLWNLIPAVFVFCAMPFLGSSVFRDGGVPKNLPVAAILLIWLCLVIYTTAAVVSEMRQAKEMLTSNSIKEAFDTLPAGICFFSERGLPVLCNTQMYRLAYQIQGKDLQMLNAKGKKILKSSYSVLQDDFFHFMRAAGYDDVERGERGSTEEHLTVTQFKVQAEQQRLEVVTGQVAQAEQSLEDAKSVTEKQKKRLEALQRETKAAKTIALTVQDIDAMGKKNAITGNISLTPDQCDTLKRYAVNGIIANADNKRLKEKLASAEKTVSIWKQRYDALNEKYQELKKKAQPYLDALEIASEKVRAFLNAILARGQEKQEHRQPDRRRGQNMEI